MVFTAVLALKLPGPAGRKVAMRVVLTIVVFLAAAWGAASPFSKLTVFVPGDFTKSFSVEDVLSKPVFVVHKSLLSPGYYRAGLVPTGLSGPDIKTDKFKDMSDFLHTSADKLGLYMDLRTFNNSRLFYAPLRTGDGIVVPDNFKVENYNTKPLPVLFLTDTLDFERYSFKDLMKVGSFEIHPREIKLVK